MGKNKFKSVTLWWLSRNIGKMPFLEIIEFSKWISQGEASVQFHLYVLNYELELVFRNPVFVDLLDC